jgi:8-oxo-dGTP pyrophosphatase MutT (NUDIX family)
MSDEKLIHPVTGEVMSPATPAATMVIFRNNPEGGPPLILMVERVKSMVFAGGAVVFPGGKVDDHDRAFAGILDHGLDLHEAAARLAVIRETIEEAGLALALDGVSNPADCAEARAALHDGASLKEICDDYGWTPRLDQLVPWARWRPPSMETRVFDTRFYLLDAGDTHLPAVVDNTENRMLFWDSAQGVLDRLARKEVMVWLIQDRKMMGRTEGIERPEAYRFNRAGLMRSKMRGHEEGLGVDAGLASWRAMRLRPTM